MEGALQELSRFLNKRDELWTELEPLALRLIGSWEEKGLIQRVLLIRRAEREKGHDVDDEILMECYHGPEELTCKLVSQWNALQKQVALLADHTLNCSRELYAVQERVNGMVAKMECVMKEKCEVGESVAEVRRRLGGTDIELVQSMIEKLNDVEQQLCFESKHLKSLQVAFDEDYCMSASKEESARLMVNDENDCTMTDEVTDEELMRAYDEMMALLM